MRAIKALSICLAIPLIPIIISRRYWTRRKNILSPRTCGDCTIDNTLFVKFMKSGLKRISELTLTEDERITLERIRNEPESLLDDNARLGENNK